MNFKNIWIVFKKEFLDVIRDRRTLMTTFLLPLILYPLLMIGLSSLISRQEKKLVEKGATIYIIDKVQDANSQKITQEFSKIKSIKVHPQTDKYEAVYKEKGINTIIEITDSLSSQGFIVYHLKIKYDAADEQSQLGCDIISKRAMELEKVFVSIRLVKLNISAEILDAVKTSKQNTASSQKMLGFFLGRMLPYFLIMIILGGCAFVSADLVAGEKERGTLETLLISGANRIDLVIGKYLTVISVSLISVFANIVSFYLSFKQIIGQSGTDVSGIQMPMDSFVLILVTMIPLATLYAAILLSISTYSRNMKEANTYFTPLMMISMMLSMVSMIPALELNLGLALIPIVNIALLLKQIIMNDFSWSLYFVCVGSTIVLDVLAVLLTFKLFNTESILFRTEQEQSFKSFTKNKKNLFDPQVGLIFFIILLAVFYYVGISWQAKDLEKGLMNTELLLILLPTVLLLRLTKQNVSQVLRFNKTNPLNYVLVAFMAFPMFILVTLMVQAINLIYPFPADYLQQMSKIATIGKDNYWKAIFLIGVLPGICEEIMFRGYLINTFKKYGFWGSIIITAVLFATFHLDIFRFLPVAILGIWLGWLLLRTNTIFIPILAHFLNNSMAILIQQYGQNYDFMKYIISGDNMNWWIALPAAAILAILYYIFNKVNPDKWTVDSN